MFEYHFKLERCRKGELSTNASLSVTCRLSMIRRLLLGSCTTGSSATFRGGVAGIETLPSTDVPSCDYEVSSQQRDKIEVTHGVRHSPLYHDF